MPDMKSTVIDLAAARYARQETRQRQLDALRCRELSQLANGLYGAIRVSQHLSPSSRAAALLSAALLELRDEGGSDAEITTRGRDLLNAVAATIANKKNGVTATG